MLSDKHITYWRLGSNIVLEIDMASWVKCTSKGSGRSIYVNVPNAACVVWNDLENCTLIGFPGDSADDVVRVTEKPETIIEAADIEFRETR